MEDTNVIYLRVWAVNTLQSLSAGQISAMYRALHRDLITTQQYDSFVQFISK